MEEEKIFLELVELKKESLNHEKTSNEYHQKSKQFKKEQKDTFEAVVIVVIYLLSSILVSFFIMYCLHTVFDINLTFGLKTSLVSFFFLTPTFLLLLNMIKIFNFNKKNKKKREELLDKFRMHSFNADDINENIIKKIRQCNLSDFLSEQDLSFFNQCGEAEKAIIDDYKNEIKNNDNLKNYLMFNKKSKNKEFNINNI